LQLRDFVELEPIYSWPVPFRFQCCIRCANRLPYALCSYFLFLPYPPSAPPIYFPPPGHRTHIYRSTFRRDQVRVDQEQEVGKGSAKVCTIDRAMPRGFGRVKVFTAPAVELDGLFVRDISEPDRQEGLQGAENTWAAPKVCPFIFFELVVVNENDKMWRSMCTIFCRPRAVTIHRAWMRPYKSRACTSREPRISSWISSSVDVTCRYKTRTWCEWDSPRLSVIRSSACG
jgi:hypothetical protein